MGIAWPITIALALALWFNRDISKGEGNEMDKDPELQEVIDRMSEDDLVRLWKLQGEILGTMVGDC